MALVYLKHDKPNTLSNVMVGVFVHILLCFRTKYDRYLRNVDILPFENDNCIKTIMSSLCIKQA